MKLICSKSNLLRGVNIVSKAVPTRTTMAILECILIDASTNEIKLMANDMELGIVKRIIMLHCNFHVNSVTISLTVNNFRI